MFGITIVKSLGNCLFPRPESSGRILKELFQNS